jgi:molybdate transport system ATP-binding protein
LLDEPLSSLDHRLRQQIIPYLCRIRDTLGVPMMYISHDLTEILQLTDRVLVMDRGRIAGYGRYTDVLHNAAVLDLVRDRGLTNVLTALVLEHHPGEGVSRLRLVSPREDEHGPPNTIWAPLAAEPPGSQVTVSIQPWDIALALQPVSGVSIQNQIHGVVQRVTTAERGVMVEIDVGLPLIVEVSRKAVASLELQPARPIVCLIKSHAFRYVGAVVGP